MALLAVVAVAVVEAVRREGRPGSPPGSWTVVPHRGLGAWVDVYDWTVELGGETPSVGPDEIDAMAEKALAAITLSGVHLQVVNPDFWPGYPWAELGATYDAGG